MGGGGRWWEGVSELCPLTPGTPPSASDSPGNWRPRPTPHGRCRGWGGVGPLTVASPAPGPTRHPLWNSAALVPRTMSRRSSPPGRCRRTKMYLNVPSGSISTSRTAAMAVPPAREVTATRRHHHHPPPRRPPRLAGRRRSRPGAGQPLPPSGFVVRRAGSRAGRAEAVGPFLLTGCERADGDRPAVTPSSCRSRP